MKTLAIVVGGGPAPGINAVIAAATIVVSRIHFDGGSILRISRTDRTAMAGGVQRVARSTYERLRHKYAFQRRGPIEVKEKGEMVTYLLLGRRTEASTSAASA